MTFYGLYKITNLLNGKMYIGQHTTSDLDDGYMGSGLILLRALKKHGVQNFRKEWLMFCEDEDELNYMERVFVDQTWVDRSDTYNINLGGNKKALSEQTRQKISQACKGKRLSEETRCKISEARKGKPLSEETRRKLSESQLGHEFRGTRGWHHSEESKKRISESNAGKHPSDETRRKMSVASMGRHPSEETLRKRSESLKAAWKRRKDANPIIPSWNRGRTGVYSEETLSKMSESQKIRCSKRKQQVHK